MSEGSRLQIQAFLEQAVKNAQNPDMKELIKKKREKRKKIIAKNFGLGIWQKIFIKLILIYE